MRSDQATQIRDWLFDLSSLADADLKKILTLAQDNPDKAVEILNTVYPQVVRAYIGQAEQIGQTIITDYTPTDVQPVPLAPIPDSAFESNIAYATQAKGDTLMILGGSMQRHIFNAYRDTVTHSIDLANLDSKSTVQTTTWARHASSTACGFCRLLATRGAVYTSEKAAKGVVGRGKEMTDLEAMYRGDKEGRVQRPGDLQFIAGGVKARGSRSLGSSYHDHCRCIPVPSTDKDPYIPPAHVSDWFLEYQNLAEQAKHDDSVTDQKSKLNFLVRNLEKVGDPNSH